MKNGSCLGTPLVSVQMVSSGVSRQMKRLIDQKCEIHADLTNPFTFSSLYVADDTNQEHIITTATFRNCGARKSTNFYDSSSNRGCSTNSFNGCTSSSSVWGFITHSDEHTPEVMQATTSITYEDCGTRFRLYDYADQNVISSVSSRTQNWMDLDGTASGLNVPTSEYRQ